MIWYISGLIFENKEHLVTGYVIMTNHIHALMYFSATDKPINKVIGDDKRFIVYEIIRRLNEQGRTLYFHCKMPWKIKQNLGKKSALVPA